MVCFADTGLLLCLSHRLPGNVSPLPKDHSVKLLQAISISLAIIISLPAVPADEAFRSELIFAPEDRHNHAPGIAELSNGDLIVSWYRGSGERKADDVAVYGARRSAGDRRWSKPFLMVDTPGFPDCNTCLMVDRDQRLWLFWPVIIANTWESCLTHYRVSDQPEVGTSIEWSRNGTILLKPDDFSDAAREVLDEDLKQVDERILKQYAEELQQVRERLPQKLYQRLGWQPRCKPTVLPSGRILLPLYTDTFSLSLMAISDDGGRSWFAGKPTLGFGAIQPTVLRRNDGTLVAYMRENGPHQKVRMATSRDEGVSWSAVTSAPLPNPGSGLDGIRLKNGHWLLVHNDTVDGRHQLAVSLSIDEGQTWSTVRHLEKHATGQYHYPAVIQAKDDRIHVVYSHFTDAGKTMKHAEFTESWLHAATDSSDR